MQICLAASQDLAPEDLQCKQAITPWLIGSSEAEATNRRSFGSAKLYTKQCEGPKNSPNETVRHNNNRITAAKWCSITGGPCLSHLGIFNTFISAPISGDAFRHPFADMLLLPLIQVDNYYVGERGSHIVERCLWSWRWSKQAQFPRVAIRNKIYLQNCIQVSHPLDQTLCPTSKRYSTFGQWWKHGVLF